MSDSPSAAPTPGRLPSDTTDVSLGVPNEIVTTRLLDAPVERVWRAFTDPAQIELWWGPAGFTTRTQQMDVRPGGVWRHTMHAADATTFANRITYREVVRHQRLAWAHAVDGSDTPMFDVTVTFERLGQRTRLTLRHVFASGAERDTNIQTYGAVQGAIETTERLAWQLVVLPDDCDFLISREIAAPRERVWAAWTDPALLALWWGPRSFHNTACDADVRVGGTYRITMSGAQPGPDVTDYPLHGGYLDVTPPQRLVMTVDCAQHPSFWHDQVLPGRRPDQTNPAGTMVQTVSFDVVDAQRTRLTVRMRMVSTQILERMVEIGIHEGWSESLERLDAVLVNPAS